MLLFSTYIETYDKILRPIEINSLKSEHSKSDIKGDLELKNIRKRKNGLWEARITQHGKRQSVYAKTLKECQKKLVQLKKQQLEEEERKKHPTFYQFAEMWFETYKKPKLSDKSSAKYEVLLKHLASLSMKMNEINIYELQTFLNSYPGTRTKEMLYTTIKAIIRKAYMLDYIKKDISIGLEKGNIKRKKSTAFTIEEQKTILHNLKDDKFSKLIFTYLLTGIRRNEVLTIKHEDIRGDYLYVRGTKTENAERYVKISDKLKNMLNSIESDPIFDFTTEYIATRLKRFGKKIGITPFGFHKLRHTFASNLYYLGVRDKERQTYMGHSTSALTNDVYTHLDPTISKKDIINIFKDWYPSF